MTLTDRLLDQLRALWLAEPARVIAALAAVAVFVLAQLGVVVDEQSVGAALAIALPILLAGEATRARVSPAGPPIGPASDDLLTAEQPAENDPPAG